MAKIHKPNWRIVLLIPAVFIIVASGAFILGMYNLNITTGSFGSEETEAPASTSPTVAEYRVRVAEVMRPFWEHISAYGLNDEITEDLRGADLVMRVQDELLLVIVPASEREAHLSFALLLDQWKRALFGSSLDSNRAILKAQQVVEDYPWIKGVE